MKKWIGIFGLLGSPLRHQASRRWQSVSWERLAPRTSKTNLWSLGGSDCRCSDWWKLLEESPDWCRCV